MAAGKTRMRNGARVIACQADAAAGGAAGSSAPE